MPAYWVVDLVAFQVEVYSRPDIARARYLHLQTYDRGDAIAQPLFDAGTVEVPVAEFLPE